MLAPEALGGCPLVQELRLASKASNEASGAAEEDAVPAATDVICVVRNHTLHGLIRPVWNGF